MRETVPPAAEIKMVKTNWRHLHGETFEGMAVTVTGGAGFIGSHLTGALLELGANVRVIDDLSGGEAANLAPMREPAGDRLGFIEASILDEARLAESIDGSALVFHQAALGSVPRSIELPRLYQQVNATGTLNVLEAARAAGVGRVMFAASSAAYGDTPTLPKVESMPVLPRSPYAATKVAGESLLRAYALSYADQGGPDTASLRYFNIFGPRQNANSAYAAVIAAFARALLTGQRPRIFGDGQQSRDFTFVDNVVHANLLAARHPRRLEGEVFNVACGQRVSVNALAGEMARLLERPELTPEHQPVRAGDVMHSLAELARIKAALDYEPIVDFTAGLAATVAWYSGSAASGSSRRTTRHGARSSDRGS